MQNVQDASILHILSGQLWLLIPCFLPSRGGCSKGAEPGARSTPARSAVPSLIPSEMKDLTGPISNKWYLLKQILPNSMDIS